MKRFFDHLFVCRLFFFKFGVHFFLTFRILTDLQITIFADGKIGQNDALVRLLPIFIDTDKCWPVGLTTTWVARIALLCSVAF